MLYFAGCDMLIDSGVTEIISPGFGVSTYPSSVECSWTITDPDQRELTLIFTKFHTEQNFDIVEVNLCRYHKKSQYTLNRQK